MGKRQHTRVVRGVKLNHQVAVLADLHHVSPLRVVPVDNGAVPRALSLVEDVHVEPVQVHRVPAGH